MVEILRRQKYNDGTNQKKNTENIKIISENSKLIRTVTRFNVGQIKLGQVIVFVSGVRISGIICVIDARDKKTVTVITCGQIRDFEIGAREKIRKVNFT